MKTKDLISMRQLREQLLGALIGLSRAIEGNKNRPTSKTDEIIIRGLRMMLANGNDMKLMLEEQIRELHEEKNTLVPRCLTCLKQCGRNDDHSLKELVVESPDILQKKMILLSEILMISEISREIPINRDENIFSLMYDTLFLLGKNCLLTELDEMAIEVHATFQKTFLHYIGNQPIEELL